MNPERKWLPIALAFILPIIAYPQFERWVYKYNSNGGDVAYCLVYGADGNLYAGGYTWNDTTGQDFTVISLTNSGAERWVYKYQTPGNNWDECNSICYGNDGNIYAAGNCTRGDSALHFTVISLTNGGTGRWVYQYPEVSSANAICYGNDGNIYAVGDVQRQILVVSLDTLGNERWTYLYPTPSSESNPGQSITYGLDGNIYVVGYTGPVENTDVTVISLAPSGSERWVYLYNGPDNYYDFGEYIIYGLDGNLYIFGSTCRLEPPGYVYWDGLAISLTNFGDERWTYISPAFHSWFSQGIYGGDGNLYIAGDFGWDIPYLYVESISDSGSYRWLYIDSTCGWASAIAYGDGNIYVGGQTSTSNLPESSYFTVMKFTSDGAIIWSYQYNPPGIGIDPFVSANVVVYGPDGNIYTAGGTRDSLTGADFTVISLSPTGIEEGERSKIECGGLKFMVSPTIVRGKAKIQCAISEKQAMRLNLYDILGRKVKTIAGGVVEPGIYSYRLDSSELRTGVYFLILEDAREKETKKILIVK